MSARLQKVKTFRAVVEELRNGLGWTIARVPFVPGEVWPEMARLRIRGEMNGVPFRTSLFAHGSGGFFLLVNRRLQREAAAGLGAMVEVSLEPDLEPRPAELPEELAALLEEEPGLREFYGGLSESMRREIGKWVAGVKSDEARMRRAQQMAERLLFAMEGERELPPIIAVAFRRRPKAKLGWERMTALQRRAELMAVMYYQTPEARERRVAKLVDTAERHA